MNKIEGKTALIVDDEKRNTFALGSYLESLGMLVKTAENGQEALTLLSNDSQVNIILLDIMMPIMDGYETLHELKQNEVLKHIPVIAVTAKAMKGDMEKCMEAGAWDYISKPLDMQVLVGKITRWIE